MPRFAFTPKLASIMLVAILFIACEGFHAGFPGPANAPLVNSIGLKLVPIPAGEFTMGSTVKPANWDENPTHRVAISQPFLISDTEVTQAQYLQYKPDAKLNENYKPYAAGVSWNDAVGFCKWLSAKEGKPYRLPTEAEWEYAARAGRADDSTTTASDANAWGVRNLFKGTVDWCADWYGEYGFDAQRDPVGPAAGLTRVVRGGYLDEAVKFKPDNYLRLSNRAGAPPNFGPNLGNAPNPQNYGMHRIGFRIVQAPLLKTAPLPYEAPYATQGVKQSTVEEAKLGPDPTKPYFRRRPMLPIPPEGTINYVVQHRAGLHPSFRFHNHSPGMAVLPNGDVLLVIYTSNWEYEPEVSLIAARLRFGAEQWDMPCPFVDTPGANDHAPLVWSDPAPGGKLWQFWGNPYEEGHFPFQYRTSDDFGATWSGVNFPRVTGPIGLHLERPQPINTVIRDQAGTLYLAVDAGGGGPLGSQSMLWATGDGGADWHDTLGRTFGRHTTFVLKRDGSILGMGGKNTGIDDHMPEALSHDGAHSFEMSKSPFSQLNGGQRPCIIRLADGKLFFCADNYPSKGERSPDFTDEEGCYVALSDDDGATWHTKRLPGPFSIPRQKDTLGYTVARQGPNGLIHVITSTNVPGWHFELNEAWILSKETFADDDPDMDWSSARTIANVQAHRENYPDGSPRITWSSGRADDGRVLLHGTETWFYPSGAKQRVADYKLGVKTGLETYWNANGKKEWEWLHKPDGTSDWTTWWPDGTLRSKSTWKNFALVDGTDKLFAHGDGAGQ